MICVQNSFNGRNFTQFSLLRQRNANFFSTRYEGPDMLET